MLNEHWLRSFRAIAEVGSFTRAAGQLQLTQAAVSQHVRHLEQQLGALFLRRPRFIELTPAGMALLQYCPEMDSADRRLQAKLASADSDQGEFALITPGSVGLALYPVLLDFQRTHPGLIIRHRFSPDPEILSAVLEKKYEVGLLALRPDDPRLRAEPFTEEALELVVPRGACADSWADLQKLGFVDHPDGQAMATRLLARKFPGNPGVRALPIHGFTNQVALILEPVSLGLGFTVIPRHARESFARQDAIEVVDCGSPVVDTLWMIHRSEWPLSGPAKWLTQQLRGLPRFSGRRAPPLAGAD